jgi:drug/metabolite transporter (DMT)-like permease
MTNMANYVLLLIMTIMGAFAGLFLKKASSSNGLKSLILNSNLYFGGVLYFFSALVNIYVLKFLEYSVVLPLTSITYIWTMIISYFILNERITLRKIIGIGFILFGATMLAI